MKEKPSITNSGKKKKKNNSCNQSNNKVEKQDNDSTTPKIESYASLKDAFNVETTKQILLLRVIVFTIWMNLVNDAEKMDQTKQYNNLYNIDYDENVLLFLDCFDLKVVNKWKNYSYGFVKDLNFDELMITVPQVDHNNVVSFDKVFAENFTYTVMNKYSPTEDFSLINNELLKQTYGVLNKYHKVIQLLLRNADFVFDVFLVQDLADIVYRKEVHRVLTDEDVRKYYIVCSDAKKLGISLWKPFFFYRSGSSLGVSDPKVDEILVGLTYLNSILSDSSLQVSTISVVDALIRFERFFERDLELFSIIVLKSKSLKDFVSIVNCMVRELFVLEQDNPDLPFEWLRNLIDLDKVFKIVRKESFG